MAATISKEDRDRATQHVHDELVKTGMQGMKPGEVEQLARGIEGFAWGKMTPASTQADYRARLQQKLISIINKWRAQQQQQIHPAQQAQQQQVVHAQQQTQQTLQAQQQQVIHAQQHQQVIQAQQQQQLYYQQQQQQQLQQQQQQQQQHVHPQQYAQQPLQNQQAQLQQQQYQQPQLGGPQPAQRQQSGDEVFESMAHVFLGSSAQGYAQQQQRVAAPQAMQQRPQQAYPAAGQPYALPQQAQQAQQQYAPQQTYMQQPQAQQYGMQAQVPASAPVDARYGQVAKGALQPGYVQRQQQPGQQQQQQQQQTLAALGALSPEALAQRYAQLHAQMRQDYLPFVSNYLRLIDPRRHPTSQDLQAKQRTWQVIYQRLTRERTAHTSPVTAQELADLRSLDGKLRDHLLKVRVQQQRTQAAQQAQQAQQLQGQPAPGQPLQHALPAAQQAQQGMAQGQPAANAAVATAVAGSAPGTAPASVRAPGMAFASVSGSVPAGSATVPPSTASEAFPTHLSGGLDLRNQAPYTSMPTPPVLTPGTDLSAAGAAQDETGLVKQEPGGLQAPPAQQLLSLLRQQPAGAALEAGAAIGQLMWHSDLDTPPIPHYLQEGALPGWLSSAALPILSRSTGSVCIDSQSGPTSPASVFLGPSSLKRKASEDSDTDTLVSEHRQRLTDEVSQVGASLAGVMNVQIVNIGETDSGCLLEVQLEPPAAQQVQQAVPDAWRRLTLRISDRYPEEAPVMVFQSLRPGSAAPQADVARQVFETSISVLQAPLTLHTIADTWRSTLGSVVKGFEAHAAQAGSTLTA